MTLQPRTGASSASSALRTTSTYQRSKSSSLIDQILDVPRLSCAHDELISPPSPQPTGMTPENGIANGNAAHPVIPGEHETLDADCCEKTLHQKQGYDGIDVIPCREGPANHPRPAHRTTGQALERDTQIHLYRATIPSGPSHNPRTTAHAKGDGNRRPPKHTEQRVPRPL